MCGPRALYDYLKRFGMGERTGIEIPAESPGLLRHLECKDRNDRWCWSEFARVHRLRSRNRCYGCFNSLALSR